MYSHDKSLAIQHKQSRDSYNIGYPCKNHLKLKYHQNWHIHILFNCQIVLKFFTEHNSETALLYEKIQNNLATAEYVMSEWDFHEIWLLHWYPMIQQPIGFLLYCLRPVAAQAIWHQQIFVLPHSIFIGNTVQLLSPQWRFLMGNMSDNYSFSLNMNCWCSRSKTIDENDWKKLINLSFGPLMQKIVSS